MKWLKEHVKALVVMCVIIGILVAVGIKAKTAQENMAAMALLEGGATVVEADLQDMSQIISVTGKIQSQHVVSVTTTLTTRCKQLNVALGDHVEKGDVLCTFDTEEIANQIKAIEEQTAKADALNAKQLEIAQRKLEEATIDRSDDLQIKSTKVTELENKIATEEKTMNDSDDEVHSNKKKMDEAKDNIDRLNAQIAGLDKSAADYQQQLSALTQQLNSYTASYNTYKSEHDYYTSKRDKAEANRDNYKEQLKTANQELTGTDKSTDRSIETAQDTIDTTTLASTATVETATTLAKLRKQLTEATIVAEQSGTITSLSISQGAAPSGTLMTISDPENLQVKTTIREKDILNMEPDMHADITSDALPDEVFSGTVSRVINFTTDGASTPAASAGGASTSSGATASSYSADILVDEPGSLLIGMTVKVVIVVKDVGKKLAVPFDTIMTEENGGNFVFVATPVEESTNYVLKKTKIVIGEATDYYTEVISGVKKGDLIVNNPGEYEDGQEVTLKDVGALVEESVNGGK